MNQQQLSKFRSTNPLLSQFVSIMRDEDDHWQTCFTEFQNSPVNGIRGKVMHRKDEYIAQDENL